MDNVETMPVSGHGDHTHTPGNLHTGLRRELARAKQRCEQLQSELDARERHAMSLPSAPLSWTPTALDKVCDGLIWTIMLLPVLLAIISLFRNPA